MLFVRKPTPESIRRFLMARAKPPFTYSAVGATAETPPAGYDVDRTRIKLGEGEQVFNLARAGWEQSRCKNRHANRWHSVTFRPCGCTAHQGRIGLLEFRREYAAGVTVPRIYL
jgi:hypothetical protein